MFFSVLYMSINSVWFMLAVFLFREILRFAPKWVNMVLWLLLAAALLIPVRIPFRFSLVPVMNGNNGTARIGETGVLQSQIAGAETYLKEPYLHADPNIRISGLNGMKIVTMLWLAGCLFFLAFAVVQYLRVKRMVRVSKPLKDGIYLCDGIDTPFLFGVIRPKIYLPSDLKEEEMRFVLMHERMHRKHGDHIAKIAGYLILCLHWFNPFVWVSWILFSRDIENVCDERVIRHMRYDDRKRYAHILLQYGKNKWNHKKVRLGVMFGESNIGRRVKRIIAYKKKGVSVSVLSLLICVMMAGCFLTVPKTGSRSISIEIPANMPEGVWYASEEISPLGKRVSIQSSSDTEELSIVLEESINAKEKEMHEDAVNANEKTSFALDKQIWYRVGIRTDNPTNDVRVITMEICNADFRTGDEAANTDKASALKRASVLFDYWPYSYGELVETLRMAGVKREDAYWAVDQNDFDFDEQAVRFVEQYKETGGWLSPEAITTSMRAYGFTDEQIQYALQECDCDWNMIALEIAERYKECGVNTEAYIEQVLKLDGFTDDQIKYALDHIQF